MPMNAQEEHTDEPAAVEGQPPAPSHHAASDNDDSGDGAVVAVPPPREEDTARRMTTVRQIVHTIHADAFDFDGAVAVGGVLPPKPKPEPEKKKPTATATTKPVTATTNVVATAKPPSARQQGHIDGNAPSRTAPFAWALYWIVPTFVAILFAMTTDLLILTGNSNEKLTITDSRQRVTFWGIERCQMIGLRVDYCTSRSFGEAVALDEVTEACVPAVRGSAASIHCAAWGL